MHRLVVLPCLVLLLSGCGERIRARPDFEQQLLDGGQAARVSGEGVVVTLQPAELPDRYRGGLTAFAVTVVNRRETPVRLSYAAVRLRGADEVWRPALAPRRVARQMLGPAVAADWLEPRGLAMRPRVGIGGGYGRYGGGFGGIGVGIPLGGRGSDPYLQERAEVNQFLGRLWQDGLIEPGTQERGIVVFDYRPGRDEPFLVELVVALQAVAGRAEPSPRYDAAAPTVTLRLGFERTR